MRFKRSSKSLTLLCPKIKFCGFQSPYPAASQRFACPRSILFGTWRPGGARPERVAPHAAFIAFGKTRRDVATLLPRKAFGRVLPGRAFWMTPLPRVFDVIPKLSVTA